MMAVGRHRLWIFNPSNDMALAADVSPYQPPKAIQRMEAEQAFLPWTWATEGDAVLTDWTTDYQTLCRQAGHELEPAPWGWSRAVRQRLLRFGVPVRLMPTDAELTEWRQLSSRESAVGFVTALLDAVPAAVRPFLVGGQMRFFHSPDEVSLPAECRSYMVKSPWSSSGRGVFMATAQAEETAGGLSWGFDSRTLTRMAGIFRHQGGLLLEPFYQKQLDFATEYEIGADGIVRFLGYSVFSATATGRYEHNYEESQPALLRRILTAFQVADNGAVLEAVRHTQEMLLRRMLAGRYRGFVGIDMMVVAGKEHPQLHPCVEMNLRMNMGIAAIMRYQKSLGKERN